MERDPQIQKSQPRNQAAHSPVGGVNRERRKLHKQRILIPEHVRPGRIANCQANIHSQKHAQKKLGALQPPRYPLRCGMWNLRINPHPGNRPGRSRSLGRECLCRLRRCRRDWLKGGRCGFRLLGHSRFAHNASGSGRVAEHEHLLCFSTTGSETPYCNGITAKPLRRPGAGRPSTPLQGARKLPGRSRRSPTPAIILP